MADADAQRGEAHAAWLTAAAGGAELYSDVVAAWRAWKIAERNVIAAQVGAATGRPRPLPMRLLDFASDLNLAVVNTSGGITGSATAAASAQLMRRYGD